MIAAANDLIDPATVPAKCCGACARWLPGWGEHLHLGLCEVRPGALTTYSAANVACDVNGGMAYIPKRGKV